VFGKRQGNEHCGDPEHQDAEHDLGATGAPE
jgi:hypothetical protein